MKVAMLFFGWDKNTLFSSNFQLLYIEFKTNF